MVVVKVDPSDPKELLFPQEVLNKIIAGFSKNGWLSINSVIPADAVISANNTINDYLECLEDRNCKGLNLKVGDKRFMESINISFDDFNLICAPKVLQILKGLLGDDLVLNSYTSVISLPGAKDQGLHSDGATLFDDSIASELPPHAVTVAIPLIDINHECGSTAVWSESHVGYSVVRGSDGKLLPAEVPHLVLRCIYV